MYTYVYCELVTGPGFLHLQAADRGKVFWLSIAAIHRPRCIGRSVHTPISEPQRRQPMALTPTDLPPTPGPLPEPSWCLAEERCVEPESWCGSKLENHSIYIYICVYIYILQWSYYTTYGWTGWPWIPMETIQDALQFCYAWASGESYHFDYDDNSGILDLK